MIKVSPFIRTLRGVTDRSSETLAELSAIREHQRHAHHDRVQHKFVTASVLQMPSTCLKDRVVAPQARQDDLPGFGFGAGTVMIACLPGHLGLPLGQSSVDDSLKPVLVCVAPVYAWTLLSSSSPPGRFMPRGFPPERAPCPRTGCETASW
jgi:hypothetical protein